MAIAKHPPPDRTEREAVRPISVIRGKYSVILPPIGGRSFHFFLPYSTKHGEKVTLMGLLKNSTWYLLMWDKETFMNQRK